MPFNTTVVSSQETWRLFWNEYDIYHGVVEVNIKVLCQGGLMAWSCSVWRNRRNGMHSRYSGPQCQSKFPPSLAGRGELVALCNLGSPRLVTFPLSHKKTCIKKKTFRSESRIQLSARRPRPVALLSKLIINVKLMLETAESNEREFSSLLMMRGIYTVLIGDESTGVKQDSSTH